MKEWPEWVIKKVPAMEGSEPVLAENGDWQWEHPRYARSIFTVERLYLDSQGVLSLVHGGLTSCHCIIATCTENTDWQLSKVIGSRWSLHLTIMTESIVKEYSITTFDSLDVGQWAAEAEWKAKAQKTLDNI